MPELYMILAWLGKSSRLWELWKGVIKLQLRQLKLRHEFMKISARNLILADVFKKDLKTCLEVESLYMVYWLGTAQSSPRTMATSMVLVGS